MKKVYKTLFFLHIFVGIGAIFGGMMAILYPEGPAGMSVDVLKNSPFKDYLIPGIILFTVIGLGNLISALTLHLKSRFQAYISSIFGWALVIWIIVQCIMLNSIVHLHIIYFIIGLIQAAFAMHLLFKEELFPANIALAILRRIRKEG